MSFEAKIVPAFNHTAMRVRDLEGAVRFYTDVVGLKVVQANGPADRPTAVFLPGIQLVRAEEQDTSQKGVLDHIGLRVENMDEIIGHLKQHGVELEGEINVIRRPGSPNVRTAFFQDPEGNRIELIERAV